MYYLPLYKENSKIPIIYFVQGIIHLRSPKKENLSTRDRMARILYYSQIVFFSEVSLYNHWNYPDTEFPHFPGLLGTK